MKKTITIILTLVCSCLFAQESYDKKMSVHALQQDFHLLKQVLTSVHPNLYLYTSKPELDSMWNRVEMQLNDSLSSVDLFRLLTPIIYSVRNAHTIIKPPQTYLDYINSDAKRLPLSFIYRNDSLIVAQNYSTNKKINSGDVITKINGISTQDLMDSLERFTFVDGYNTAYSDYLSSRFLSKRYAYFIGLPSHFDLAFFDSTGHLKHEKIESLSVKEFYKAKVTEKEVEKYDFKIENEVAYLTIRDFIIGNVRKFNKDLNDYFKRAAQEKIEYFVLDLRNNRGGNPEATNKLLSFFIDKQVYPVKEKFTLVDKLPDNKYLVKNDAYKYFHKAKMKKLKDIYVLENETKVSVKPHPNHYQGRLIVLINENCASATTSFLGQIRTHVPDALFIGNTTLGNPYIVVADYVVSLQLPNSNIIVKIPLVSSEKNVNFENPKGGVAPDVVVPITVEDVQFKVDNIKKKTHEIIREMKKTADN